MRMHVNVLLVVVQQSKIAPIVMNKAVYTKHTLIFFFFFEYNFYSFDVSSFTPHLQRKYNATL